MTAHCASLPLLSLLRELEGLPTPEVAQAVSTQLEQLAIIQDVEAVIIFCDGHSTVNLEPNTTFGQEVLHELVSSSEFFPCPPGDCELKGGRCIWCGGT